MARRCLTHAAILSCLCLAHACGDDGDVVDAGHDAGDGGGTRCLPPAYPPDAGSCDPRPTDYAPGAEDDWPSCVSDDGRYHRIEPTISSVARVAAFEQMADLLFDAERDPSPDDFLLARRIYQEDEGLDSRVVRRYDPHVDAPPGTDCTADGVPEAFPDYCVGPATLQPLILQAMNDGFAGREPRAQAARIEAALLWFLYVSTYKESTTCTTKAKDCDSAYAYYSGGEPARCGVGLSRYVAEVSPNAHDRAWDGLLALRCWRDLDDGDVASDLARRDLARAQLDRAVLHGLAALLQNRLLRVGSGTASEEAYHFAFAQTLGGFLHREASERSPAQAAVLRAELEKSDPSTVDGAAASAALAALFVCP